jgi:hypothetical protein
MIMKAVGERITGLEARVLELEADRVPNLYLTRQPHDAAFLPDWIPVPVAVPDAGDRFPAQIQGTTSGDPAWVDEPEPIMSPDDPEAPFANRDDDTSTRISGPTDRATRPATSPRGRD